MEKITKDGLLSFTENKVANRSVLIALPVVIVVLVIVIISSIMEPVKFNKEKAARENVGIERLKDIRTLQEAYKSTNGEYASCMDSLLWFYENGEISVKMQIGSKDDSLTYAHTKEIRQSHFWLRGADLQNYLYELYKAGDHNVAFTIETRFAVKDTLFNGRENFNVKDLALIPFSGGAPVEMDAVVKTVSGVKVPLFEARMPYKLLLKGMDNQLRINLDADRRNSNKYEGLQVGSITSPNNNAGNWE